MTTTALPFDPRQWLLAVLPAMILGGALALLMPRVAELRRLQGETAALRQEAATAALSQPSLPARDIPAAPPAVRGEQHRFLEEVSRLAVASGVRLVGYKPPAAERGASAGQAQPEASLLLPRLTEVTIEGSYRQLIAFFRSLERAGRLYASETLSITAPHHPRLTATFRLARFVVRETR